MREIYILLIFCIVFCSCLNRDNLPPYQTTITKNKNGSSMLEVERKKMVSATKDLKKISTDVQDLYQELAVSYSECLDQLKLCCEREDIKRPAYQDALSTYESKYEVFFSYAKENIKDTQLSEDIYPIEIAMKRIYNRYRQGNAKTRSKALAAINTFKLPSFDKL